MLNTMYNYYTYSMVVDLADFYRTPLPECLKIKSIIGSIKLLFSLPESFISLEVAEGMRVYRIALLTQDVHKYPFGWFCYLPEDNRLDVYLAESPGMPFIQWKDKKIVYKGYQYFFDKLNIDTLFKPIINVL